MTPPFRLTPSPDPYDLDALNSIAGAVMVFGERHEVREPSGAEYRAILSYEESPAKDDPRPLYDVAARLVPTLSEEQVAKLTARQVGAIMGVAGLSIRTIAEQFPNSSGPTETAAVGPA